MPAYPKTRRSNFSENIHDIQISDPYRWLETENKERTRWIAKQNKYTTNILNRVPGRRAFRKRLEELVNTEAISAPSVRDNNLFFFKSTPSQENSVLYMRNGKTGEDIPIIDPNKWDRRLSLTGVSLSQNMKYICYLVSCEGSDWNEVKIMDFNGVHINEQLPLLPYVSIKWINDNTFYYNRSPKLENGKFLKNCHQLFIHHLGTSWQDDEPIFGEGLIGDNFVFIDELSKDRKHATIDVSNVSSTNELYYFNTNNKEAVSITAGLEGHFSVDFKNNRAYLISNFEDKRNKIYTTKIESELPHLNYWEQLIAPRKGFIEDFSVFDNKIFVKESENFEQNIYEYSSCGKFEREFITPGIGVTSIPYGSEENDNIFFTFHSYFHPLHIYEYNIKTGKSNLFMKNELPFNEKDFISEKVMYRSKDGTQVPMFVLRKKTTQTNGKNPTILYGYGGFNISPEIYFNQGVVTWLETGGIYAVAHIRGGDEFGKPWHEAGMLAKKQNVFDDFIAAGEALTGTNDIRLHDAWGKIAYTQPSLLGILGGSNGGLLTGAVLVQRPDLWGAAISEVPLLDMLRFHLTEGGKKWVTEYGNPENSEDAKFLHAYSPYHNVKAVSYPPTLLETSLGDDRGVDPMHAMKMTAMLQYNNKSSNPIMLLVKKGVGHCGATTKGGCVEELLNQYAFFMRYLRK